MKDNIQNNRIGRAIDQTINQTGDQAIYQSIYKTVADNMLAAGEIFHYKECTFLNDVNSDPCVVDVSKYIELNNEDFLQATFVATYKRLPEEREWAAWTAILGLEKEAFQTAVLRKFVRSSVVAINHIHFINIPYFRYREGLYYHVMGILYGLTDKSSLREFGKKLPQPIQKIIRRIFI